MFVKAEKSRFQLAQLHLTLLKLWVLPLLFAIPPICAKESLTAMQILQRTADSYRTLRSYDLLQTVRTINDADMSIRLFGDN